MTGHEQVWVKTNSHVDRGIAGIVMALSSMEGLETLQSCQESHNGDAYVYFWYGNWESVCRLVFDGLLPEIQNSGVDASGAVEVLNSGIPTGKIWFSAREIQKVYLALNRYVSSASGFSRNSVSPRDTEYKEPLC